jgi:hypothetical protein
MTDKTLNEKIRITPIGETGYATAEEAAAPLQKWLGDNGFNSASVTLDSVTPERVVTNPVMPRETE